MIAKAKALTTWEVISLGIGAVVERVLAHQGVATGDAALMLVATILATNALVEGEGGCFALIFIGFTDADVDRVGLRDALAGNPIMYVAGGDTPLGEPREPLDLDTVRKAAVPISGAVEAFAVVAQFGVRNPLHELQVRHVINEIAGLPDTCGHELSAQLGSPKRALTCVLYVCLVGMIAELLDATETILERWGILASLMPVRGDDFLVTAEFTRKRPIETTLYGPAASLIGAPNPMGLTDAIISDIGGMTPDIAGLCEGRPERNSNGALVGGYQTMVEGIDMVIHGLGGDSEVWFDEKGSDDGLWWGPRRVIPARLLSCDYRGLVDASLELKAAIDMAAEYDGRFPLTNRRSLGPRDDERRL